MTVERVTPAKEGDVLSVRIRFLRDGTEKRKTYRVSAEEYENAGCPAEGEEISRETFDLLTARTAEKEAYERAVQILAAGDNSGQMLCRKLCERGFSREAAIAAVTRLIKEGYLNEQAMLERQFAIFAERMWGPGKYMPALLQKGFSRAAIEAAAQRAADEGVYDEQAIRARLTEEFRPSGTAEKIALLYKYGFR